MVESLFGIQHIAGCVEKNESEVKIGDDASVSLRASTTTSYTFMDQCLRSIFIMATVITAFRRSIAQEIIACENFSIKSNPVLFSHLQQPRLILPST